MPSKKFTTEQQIVLPEICVFCGNQSDKTIKYFQRELPIIGPFFAISTTQGVEMPYCNKHLKRFKLHFLYYYFFQTILFIAGFIIFGLPSLSKNEDLSIILNINYAMSESAEMFCTIFGAALIGLSGLSLLIRKHLYDARIDISGKSLTISAKSEKFLDAIQIKRESN